jgi:ectoine hydroxylase-related dioxygenase (phytanoyl-CoA dioxygenase family)
MANRHQFCLATPFWSPTMNSTVSVDLVAQDLGDAKRILKDHGLAILPGVLSAAELADVKHAVDRAIRSDRDKAIQLQGFAFDPDEHNIRLFDLVSKDKAFRDLVEHPIAVDIVRWWLGAPVSLSNFSGNITAPGSGAMGVHADAGYMPVPVPPYPMAVNIAWAIDDFTAENGGTCFVPGSYHLDFGPDHMPEPGSERAAQKSALAPSMAIVCPAGSMFAMDGRVWHHTGCNTTADATRVGLFAYYTRQFIRPQFNWHAVVPDEVLESASPLLREMLGFAGNAATGNADYPQLRGTNLRRPQRDSDAH